MGNRFKKGDKISGYAEAYGNVTGEIVDIDETSVVDPYRVKLADGTRVWVHEIGAKLVWQPKVGDRVRYDDGFVIGEGALVEIADDHWLVEVEPKDRPFAYYRNDTCREFYDLEYLSPVVVAVEEHSAAPIANDNAVSTKLKVGDIVRGRNMINDEIEGVIDIVDDSDHDLPYHVENCGWCRDGDLELATDEPANDNVVTLSVDAGSFHEELDAIISKLERIVELKRQVGLAA